MAASGRGGNGPGNSDGNSDGNGNGNQRIEKIFLEESSRVRLSAQIEHERRSALFDLEEENTFAPVGSFPGPFILRLAVRDQSLRFEVHDSEDRPLTRFSLPLGSLRRIIKDYFYVCDSYYKSIKTASPSRIEAIDMGRRGLHNEGAELLQSCLDKHAAIDIDTARRLFTLICVLHIRH